MSLCIKNLALTCHLVDSAFNPPVLNKMHKRVCEQCCSHCSCTRACTCGERKVYLHHERLINRLPFSFSDIVMEEAPTTPIAAPPVLRTPPPPLLPPPPPAIAAPPSLPPPPTPPSPALTPEKDGGRRGGAAAAAGGGSGGGRLGLTKEVLSAHTQQEEQNFMCRFRDLSQLRVFDPASVLRRHSTTPITRGRVISAHLNTCKHTRVSLLANDTFSDKCNGHINTLEYNLQIFFLLFLCIG